MIPSSYGIMNSDSLNNEVIRTKATDDYDDLQLDSISGSEEAGKDGVDVGLGLCDGDGGAGDGWRCGCGRSWAQRRCGGDGFGGAAGGGYGGSAGGSVGVREVTGYGYGGEVGGGGGTSGVEMEMRLPDLLGVERRRCGWGVGASGI
ncbi:hypothetical protein F0562_030801 [Nyssa sinensis]|uniref:Uncharacterized protein n=1 Tax=Nyssa sinensis TaxID=561372 RepID=A0A5J5AZT7_9ASTE|nr:hypothetical protein F0562_030801 [Nyssa sinensis]